MAQRSAKRTEYRNNTQGYIGVIKVNRRGEEVQEGVQPFGRVFLTEEEVELTERSRALAKDSPFLAVEIVHNDLRTGAELARFTAPKLEAAGPDTPERPTGNYMQGEEVATPVAS